MPAKAKKIAKKKTEEHVNGKHGEVISFEQFEQMEKYLTTAKNMMLIHDDEIDEIDNNNYIKNNTYHYNLAFT